MLKVRPVRLYTAERTDWLGKNDCFIDFEMGSQKVKTSTKIDDNSPSWSQYYTFKYEGNNILKFTIYDEDNLKNDDIIGTGSLDLNNYFAKLQPTKVFVKLSHSNKPRGKILFDIKNSSQPLPLKKKNVDSLDFLDYLRQVENSNIQIQYYNPQKHHDYQFDFQVSPSKLTKQLKEKSQKMFKASYTADKFTQEDMKVSQKNIQQVFQSVYVVRSPRPVSENNKNRRLRPTSPIVTAQNSYKDHSSHLSYQSWNSRKKAKTENYEISRVSQTVFISLNGQKFIQHENRISKQSSHQSLRTISQKNLDIKNMAKKTTPIFEYQLRPPTRIKFQYNNHFVGTPTSKKLDKLEYRVYI